MHGLPNALAGVCVREKERERVCVRERKSESVCVCERERVRKRRDIVCIMRMVEVCVCA